MTNESAVLTELHKLKKTSVLGSWISRIMSNKMYKQAMVHPCIIDGKHTLVYEQGLARTDPLAFQHIIEFADKNGFIIREDRRRDFLEGVKRVKNKRRANVVTIMALTATLLTQNVVASTDNPTQANYSISEPLMTNAADADIELNDDMSQEQLMSAMIGWINTHSSFSHDIDKMPGLFTVSAQQIAEVAFGGELPQAVDPEKLNIYGLYNFNEEAIYILDSLDLSTDKGRGILLHELVHFLQYQSDQDKDVKCKNELVSLAYLLEAKFLQTHDHDHSISITHIKQVSQCS